MSRYTVELSDAMKDPSFDYFDFSYDFYSDDAAAIENFEKKFLQHYWFHEIGQETMYRHKWSLKSHLDKVMPYYKQLYITELKSRDIEFLLNKDYKETFKKSFDKNALEDSLKTVDITSSQNTKRDTTDSQSGTALLKNKTSSLNDGVAEVGLTDGKVTSVSEDNNTNTLNGEGSEIGNINGKSENTIQDSKHFSDIQNEEYELIGKGNIGTTSSAELLEKWREVLINIDEQIIESCRSLFMMVY